MIDQLLTLLPAEYRPLALSAVATIGLLRLLIKPFGAWLKCVITRAAEKASESLDPEDDTIIEAVLDSTAYRLFAFLLDLFASVKLPARQDLFAPKNSTTAP